MVPHYSLLHLLLLALNFAEFIVGHGFSGDASECYKVRRCSKHRGGGPAVRFPFRLRDHHPPYCGYPDPGFELSCDQNKHAVLNLPMSAKLFVKKINYKLQQLVIYDPVDHCLPRLLLNSPHLNISASPFHYVITDYYSVGNFAIYNCSLSTTGGSADYYNFNYIHCLSNMDYGVRAVSNDSSILELTGCCKIADTPVVPRSVLIYRDKVKEFLLEWSAPNCRSCEQQGRGCSILNNNHIKQCFHLPPTGEKKKLLMAGAILGSFLLVVATIGLYQFHFYYKQKRKNEMKIKQFLEDYKALKSTRYSYADVKNITNQFKERLGQGAFGTVYKGKLANNILVAVKILNHNSAGNGDEFINEVASMGRIHHVNVARLVGFCADGANRALVYEFLPNESLEKFIFSETDKKIHLGWEKLQDIALGIAKGMEYLHHGCEQQILHFDIKPHNVLLDHNFVPKISDFGLAKLCSKEKSVVTMTAVRGTMGYIAPEVASRNFGKPSYKSDVYSFGMLLLEMVGGRRNIDVNVENASQVYFPEWVYSHFDQLGGKLRIEIEEEGHAKIAKKLTIVALSCVQWHPIDRPSMKAVVQMLEGDGDNLTLPPNPFVSGDATKTATKQSRPLHVELEIISEVD